MNNITKLYFDLQSKILELSWEITYDKPDEINSEFLEDLADVKEQTAEVLKEYDDPENDEYVIKLANEIISLCDKIIEMERKEELHRDISDGLTDYLCDLYNPLIAAEILVDNCSLTADDLVFIGFDEDVADSYRFEMK